MREITETWSNVDWLRSMDAGERAAHHLGAFLIENIREHGNDEREFWLGRTGLTADIELAYVFNFTELGSMTEDMGDVEETCYIHKLYAGPRQPVVPPAPGAKCAIENVLHKPLLDILKFAPEAEMVRARVHAAVLLPIPTEAKTYEQIKGWIESTIVPGTIPTPPPYTPEPIPATQAPALAEAAPPTPNPQGVDFLGYMRERERGTATFRRECEGRGDYHFPANRILGIVSDGLDGGESWEEIENSLLSIGDEIVHEDPPETEAITETEDFEVDEVQNSEPINWGPSDRDAFKQAMRDYIRLQLPDYYRRIHAQGEENETDVPF